MRVVFLLSILLGHIYACVFVSCVPSVQANTVGVVQVYEKRFIEINSEVELLRQNYKNHSKALDEDIKRLSMWTNEKIELEKKLKELIRIKKEIEHAKYHNK